MSVITALFLKMGKVVPYFKMTPELANQLHSYLGKIMMYAKSSGAKLTKQQQDYIMDQTRQLDLYEKSMTPPTPKGPKAEVVELKPSPESPYGKPGGWMPSDEETKGIMSRVKFNEDLVQDTIDLLKGKTDEKSFQDEIKKIIGRKGTYSDYSDAEIKGVLDGIEADTKKQIKSAEEIIDEGDFDPSGFKDGGRIGYSTGAGVNIYRGIKSLMETLNKKFGKGTLRTAENIARPESAITRDLFKRMSKKLQNKLPKKGEFIEDGETPDYEYYAELLNDAEDSRGFNVQGDETIEVLEDRLKQLKDEEAYWYGQYKAGKLDPEPGEVNRSRLTFLKNKSKEAEMSGDKRLITQDELEELDELEKRFEYLDLEEKAQDVSRKLTKEEIKKLKELDDMGYRDVLIEMDRARRTKKAKGGLNYLMGL